MNSQNSKRSKRDQSPTCSSPIRMSQSIWNTPDPSILQMLEQDSDGNIDEWEETPTMVCEEPTPSFIPTQSSNKTQILSETIRIGNAETNSPGGSKEREGRFIERGIEDEVIGEEPLLLTGRALLGKNLFEPSNWMGVDSIAFCESDSE